MSTLFAISARYIPYQIHASAMCHWQAYQNCSFESFRTRKATWDGKPEHVNIRCAHKSLRAARVTDSDTAESPGVMSYCPGSE